jgi:hypothetical protein
MAVDNVEGRSTTIEIETPDLPVAFNMKVDAPEGVTVFVPPIMMKRSDGAEGIATIILTLTGSVVTSAIGSWLYDKLKAGRSRTVKINRREIEIENGEITRIIEECITESNAKDPKK